MLEVVHVVVTENFAGVERHVAILANAQAEQGLRVTVLGGHPEQMSRELRGDVDFQPVRNVPSAVAALRRHRHAHIFHAHMTAAEGACVAASVGTSVPVVTTRHFAAARARRGGFLVRNAIARRIAAQVSVSRFVAQCIDGPSYVVYAGVEARDYISSAARERSILMAQRLESEKDTAVGLVAFQQSGLARQGWVLRLAGTGKLRTALESMAADMGIQDAVEFLGFRQDVQELMSACGVFLASAPAEPFGLSVAEAMASGTPVVAAGGGGHLESVGLGAPELLFPPGDVSGAADLLENLAENPGLRDDAGGRLRDTQRVLFTPAEQQESTMRIYEAVTT